MTEGSFSNSQVSGKNRELMDLYMPCYQGHNLIGFTGGGGGSGGKRDNNEEDGLAENWVEQNQELRGKCDREKEKLQRLCEKKIEKCEKDCEVDKTESACVPDYNIFKTFRNNIDDVVVKSVKTGENWWCEPVGLVF
ncbi:MAG: hypothetical protein ACR5KV_05620 [Wolbachia sp.]